MKKELNIAAILKDKPAGTKLWSPVFGDCTLDRITSEDSLIWAYNTDRVLETFYPNGKYDKRGECVIFPSKEMRDWSKFFKKGDVLESDNKLKRCIFKEWANDDYTNFNCFAMDEGWNDYFSKINSSTFEYHKADDFVTELHIKRVEKKFGGKLNLETLEIEKQTEFKDGDIVVLDGDSKSHYKTILLYQTNIDDEYEVYSFLNTGTSYLGLEATLMDDRKARLATDSEKQQLFSALEKEGKRWNPDTKQIEDLPKKCEFKPMDWCLMKDSTKYWELCQFAYTKKVHGTTIYSAVGGLIYYKCIPYNEETAHLLGTTDEWKGGEQ